MPRRARYRHSISPTGSEHPMSQPPPRVPLAQLAARRPSPTLARVLAQTKERKAGEFNSSI